MAEHKTGDHIEVKAKDSTYEGTFIPSHDEKTITIKLDNGYNIGFSKKDTQVKVIKKAEEKKQSKKILTEKKGLKKISILHCGGTVASKVDYKTGGVIASFSPEELIELFPEIKEIANIRSRLVSQMMSEDMNFPNYKKIAEEIKKEADDGSDGIIITHGTDTLHYTSSAMSFMIEDSPIPVLLVGSQRSSDRGSSDAAMNLVSAIAFCANTDFADVGICMHENSSDSYCHIIPGTKARKMHTSRRDAFRAINTKPFARIEFKTNNIEIMNDSFRKRNNEKISIKSKMSNEVAILKTYPDMKKELFEFYTKNYKALVLEGTGLGHAPTNTKENLENYGILKKYIEKGGIVCMTSQCIYGKVHPHVYANLRRLSNIGIIYCEDMTTETAYIKLSWLLANKEKEAKELLNKNLRGEISERIENSEFLS